MNCVTIIITKYTVNKRRILWMRYYESDTLEKSECGAFKWYGNNKHKSCAVHGACDCCELIKVVFIGSINVVAPSTRPCWQAWSAVAAVAAARQGGASIADNKAYGSRYSTPHAKRSVPHRPPPATRASPFCLTLYWSRKFFFRWAQSKRDGRIYAKAFRRFLGTSIFFIYLFI